MFCRKSARAAALSCSVAMLSACGSLLPEGSLGGLAAEYAGLARSLDTNDFTPNTQVAASSGSASYSGVGNFSNGSADQSGFLGNIDVAADFDNRTMSGSAGGFVEFDASNPSVHGPSAPGSLAINGNFGLTNELAATGLIGTAAGSIDGVTMNMGMTGNFLGSAGDGMVLYFLDTGISDATGFGLLSQ